MAKKRSSKLDHYYIQGCRYQPDWYPLPGFTKPYIGDQEGAISDAKIAEARFPGLMIRVVARSK